MFAANLRSKVLISMVLIIMTITVVLDFRGFDSSDHGLFDQFSKIQSGQMGPAPGRF